MLKCDHYIKLLETTKVKNWYLANAERGQTNTTLYRNVSEHVSSHQVDDSHQR